jgi:UDPglucose 6-dehydrogenase
VTDQEHRSQQRREKSNKIRRLLETVDVEHRAERRDQEECEQHLRTGKSDAQLARHCGVAPLEASSGRIGGHDFGLCYNPEFIALGSVISGLLHPDYVLVGELDKRSGDILERLYGTVLGDAIPIIRMNLINAELTKISVNTYVTTKISYANMLADICDRLPGADVDAVTKALGADTRIGPKYLKGAMGYGGPCFPRDNVAFAALARKIGARADVAEATDRINNYQVDRLTGLVGKFAKAGMRIAILGLSYKPQTPVVEESHSVKLAAKLADAGYIVVVHDPLAQDSALAVLGDKVVGASSIEGAVRGCDLLIIATGWPDYKAIDAAWCKRNGQRLTVLDLWRTLPAEKFAPVADVLYLGSGR